MPSYKDPQTVQRDIFEQAWSPWRRGMQANTDAARAGAANARQDEQLEQQRLLNRQNLTEGRQYAEQQLQKQRTYSQGETDKLRLQSARDLFVGAGGDLKSLGPNPDFNTFNSAIFKLKNQNRTRGVLESNLSKYGVFLSPPELATIPLDQYADTLQKAKEGFDLRNLQARARNLDVTHRGPAIREKAVRDAEANLKTVAARSQRESQAAEQELERTQGPAPYSPMALGGRVPATQEAVNKWAAAVERAPAALEQAKARAASAQAEAAQDLAAAKQSVPEDLGFHELSEAIKDKEWDIGQDREAQIQASQKRKDNRDAKIAEKVKIDALYAEGKLEAARPELEKSFAYHRNVIATIREKMAADITKVLEGDDIDPVEYARHSNAAILKVLGEAGVADDVAADLLKKLTSKAIDEIKLLEKLSVDKPALFARIQDEIYNTTGQTKEKFEALLDFVGKKGYSDEIKLTQQFLSKLQTEYPMFRETRPDNPLAVPRAGDQGALPASGSNDGDPLLPLLPPTDDSNALYNSLINEIKLTEEEAKELADYSQYLPSGANTLASAPVTQEVLREFKKFRDKDVAAQLDNISGALFGTFGGGWFGLNALGGLPKYIYPTEIIAEFDEIAKKKIGKNATWKDLKVAHIPDEYEVPVGNTSKGHSTYTQTSDEMSVADKEELLKNLRWYEEAVRIDKLLKKAAKEKGWDIGPKPPKVKPKVNILPIGT